MKPYFQDDAVTIYLGDCREILPQLPKVDLVLTDPPYKTISGGISSISPRGGWMSDYTNNGKIVTCDITWNEIAQVCYQSAKENTDTYVMANNTNIFECHKELLSIGFKYHNLLVWDKICSTPNRWYMKNCEFILYCYKGKAKPINNCGSQQLIRIYQEDAKWIDKETHPTEKPVDLFQLFITNSTDINALILDPFMGSGTTLRAAKNLGRKAIGIEIEERYCEIAAKRMAQTVMELKCES